MRTTGTSSIVTLCLAVASLGRSEPALAFDCSRMSDPSYVARQMRALSARQIERHMRRCLSPDRRRTRPSKKRRARTLPQTGAGCLEIQRPYRTGSVGFLKNRCGHGISVRWRTESGHRALKWVRAYGRVTAGVGPSMGRIRWGYCRSDRPYARNPRVTGGRWSCP